MLRREPPVARAVKSFHLSRIGVRNCPARAPTQAPIQRGPPRPPPRTAVSSAETFARSFPVAPPPQSGSTSPFPAAQNVPSFSVLRPCRRFVRRHPDLQKVDHAPDRSRATCTGQVVCYVQVSPTDLASSRFVRYNAFLSKQEDRNAFPSKQEDRNVKSAPTWRIYHRERRCYNITLLRTYRNSQNESVATACRIQSRSSVESVSANEIAGLPATSGARLRFPGR